MPNKLIQVSSDGRLAFGDHQIREKQKQEGFEFAGDIYKIKSHDQVTRLEKNSRLLYESVPGTTVVNFDLQNDRLAFEVDGSEEDARLTVELEPKADYKIFVNQTQVGKVKANLSGKISLSVDFATGKQMIEFIKMSH